MRKNIYFSCLFILVATHAFAQQSIRDARKRSWQCAVYRINADTAEKYISKYVVFPEHYLNETPFAIWHADTLKYEELPVGNYLIFSTVENELLAEYYCQSNLKVFPLNNQHRVQLEVKDNAGKFPANAMAWVNKKEIKYDAGINGFQLKNKKPDEALIKITVPGDTLFMELIAMEDIYRKSGQDYNMAGKKNKIHGHKTCQ
jgi:alpha-2-macroglobulin